MRYVVQKSEKGNRYEIWDTDTGSFIISCKSIWKAVDMCDVYNEDELNQK